MYDLVIRKFQAPVNGCLFRPQLLTGTVHAGLQESGHVLHIERALLSHEGQYTCVVTNSAGEDKRDFHVSIQGASTLTFDL